MVWLWLWQLLIGHHGHTVTLVVFFVSPALQNLFLDKEDRRTLKSQIEPASAVPGEGRCTLHAPLRLLVFFLLVHSVFVSKPPPPLRDVDFECASWLLFLGTQRSWYGFGRPPVFQLRLLALPAVLRVRFFLKFPHWLFLKRWQRLLVVHVPSCWTARSKRTYVIRQTFLPLCPCEVM